MWVSLVFALTYVLFSLIYDVSGGMAGDDPYIYEVLDWNNNTGSAVGYSAGVVLIVFPLVSFSCMLIILKCATRRCCAGSPPFEPKMYETRL